MRRFVFYLVCGLLLTLGEVGMAAPGDTHYVKPLQAEVHAAPSDASKVKFVIAVGRKVLEFERQSEWVNVGVDKSGGLEGWVHKTDLTDTDPDGLRY